MAKKAVKGSDELKKRTNEAVSSVDELIKSLKKEVARDLGIIKVKYKEGEILRKVRMKVVKGLRDMASKIEGGKTE